VKSIKRINILLIFLLLLSALIPLYADQFASETISSVFEYKNKIEPYNNYKQLLNNPKEIDSHITPKLINGVKLLDTLFDFHEILDIPITKLINILIDLEHEQNIFPRMIYTKDLNPEDSLWEAHLQDVKTQFSFGGLKQDYHYIFYKIPILNKDGSFLIKWNLYKSIDKKFNFIYGSWYLKEMVIDNKTYTYVRNYIHYELNNVPPYVILAMHLGGRQGSKNFFKALKKANN